MAAYVIATIEVTDPVGFQQYLEQAKIADDKYGAQILALSNKVELFEGQNQPSIAAILQFESIDQAKTWYNSPEYQAAIPYRIKAATFNLIAL